MVCPSGRRGDDDIGSVTNRTCRVQGRTVTASSRGVRGRHSTSNLPSTPLPAGFYHDTGAPGSPARQLGAEFFKQMVGTVQPDSSYNTHGYTARDCGVSSSEPFIGRRYSVNLGVEADRGPRNKRPDKARDVPASTQRKRVKASDWEQIEPAEGDRDILKCRSRYMTLTGWSLTDPQELFDVATSRRSTMSSSDRAACYIQYLLDRATVYSRTPYPISGGTQACQQQDWFLPRSHPRLQNPVNIPHGFHVPVDLPMLDKALLDLIASEARREDAGKEEKFDRIANLLSRHYHST
ncbi:hypothetical protein M9H77_06975 [Catharanthus roseus]|uniref:Uncharacterized protein n=1 Tax=Catharanthus roseus TaxID=4058 RepID=A0ACC0BTL0_CATRO|nr:hypothetical protein M9H77_06975 [Catharanthus roseus]